MLRKNAYLILLIQGRAQGRGTTSTTIARGPPGPTTQTPRESREDPSRPHSPLVLSPRPDHQHYNRPPSSASSHARSRASDDRREGEGSGEQVPITSMYRKRATQTLVQVLSIHSLHPVPTQPKAMPYARPSQALKIILFPLLIITLNWPRIVSDRMPRGYVTAHFPIVRTRARTWTWKSSPSCR